MTLYARDIKKKEKLKKNEQHSFENRFTVYIYFLFSRPENKLS